MARIAYDSRNGDNCATLIIIGEVDEEMLDGIQRWVDANRLVSNDQNVFDSNDDTYQS